MAAGRRHARNGSRPGAEPTGLHQAACRPVILAQADAAVSARQVRLMDTPPSTSMAAPVTKLAASEAR